MFERFTDQARRVVVVAQEESRKLGHDYIGTEHILLGILGAGESVAVQALASLGVSLEAAREQVESFEFKWRELRQIVSIGEIFRCRNVAGCTKLLVWRIVPHVVRGRRELE